MSNNFSYYLVVSLFSTLIAAPVFGADAQPAVPAPAASAPADLTIKQFKDLGFSIVHKGVSAENDNANTEVYLTGAINRRCFSHFTFTNTQSSDEITGKKLIGFRISDDGQGYTCQIAERGKACTKESCVYLSSDVEVPNARMNLSEEGDSEITLIKIDQSRDPADPEFGDNHYLNPQSFDIVKKIAPHVSKATIKAQAEAKALAARQAKIEELLGLVSACRNSSDEIAIGRKSARSVARMDKTAIDLQKVLRELDTAEFKLLTKRAEKGPMDDFDSLREDLKTWDNPDNADDVAKALRTMAVRTVNKTNVSTDDYLTARDLLKEAQGLDGISTKTAKGLANDQDANNTGYLSALGMSGDLFSFNLEFQKMSRSLMERVRQNCYGKDRSQEGCSTAVSTYRNVSTMPQQVQAILLQRQQEEQKLQQQMAQMLGGASGGMQQMPMQPGGAMPAQNNNQFYGGMGMTGAPMQNPGFAPMQANYGMSGMAGIGMGGSGAWSGGMYGRQSTF